MRLIVFSMVVLGLIAASPISPKPQGSEMQFVTSVQRYLMPRFPTPADAMRAGYFRYTDEDATGAISYVNLHWTSANPQQPSQLWYDVHGHLLGADYSRPYSPKPPKLWGVNPRRWAHFAAHVHWVVADAHGTETYGAAGQKVFSNAGGNPKNPQAATALKLSKAGTNARVEHVFPFPNIWDLEVWIKPNPKGAFAANNPLVKPSKNASKESI